MADKEQKIRVLQVMHGLAPGGIGTFALTLFENIERAKFDVKFALATDYPQFHEQRILDNGGVIYKTSDLNGLLKKWKHFFRLIRLMKTEGPFDIVHSHIDFFNGVNLLAAWIAGVPIRVCHSHGTNSANALETKATMFIKLYRYVMGTLINLFTTHKVGCSEMANDYMYSEKWKNNNRNKVIYNAIDLQKYAPRNFDKSQSLKMLNFKKDQINIVTIGKMCESKNSLFIEEIISELSKIRNDFHFIWVGDGRLQNQIKENISIHEIEKKISFLGVRRDIPEILSAMDFFLFPSKWEGLGIVLIEAQAMNIPCFISDTIPQEADLGLCTVLSLDDDAKTWAEKINNYIKNKSYHNTINKEKLERYDVKNMVKEMEKIYAGA